MLVFAFGVAAIVFLAACAQVGSVGSPLASIVTLAFVLVPFILAMHRYRKTRSESEGSRAALLLRPADERLSFSFRSALELADRPSGNPEMRRAHASRVLREMDAAETPPMGRVRKSLLLGGGFLLLVVAGAFFFGETLRGGAYALTHPSARDEGGAHLAAFVTGVEAELIYPAYLQRPSETIAHSEVIEAPRGTRVRWSFSTREPVDALELLFGESPIRLQQDGERYVADFLLREDGVLTLSGKDEEERLVREARRWSFTAFADPAPTVGIAYEGEAIVEAFAQLSFGFSAQDNDAIRSLSLVLTSPEGEVRRPIAPPPVAMVDDSLPWEGAARLELERLSLRPDDEVTVWLEAEDGNDVDGPGIGQSDRITLTIASERTRRAARIAGLAALLDATLDRLADRIELPLPEEDEPAAARHRTLNERERTLLSQIDEVANLEQRRRAILTTLHRELKRAVDRDSAMYPRGENANRARRDEEVREVLERLTIRLDDLLTTSELEDSAAIARELETLRRELVSLLESLASERSDEAEAQLRAAIERTRTRMRQLLERMASMREEHPSEFLNPAQTERAEQSEEALDALSRAMEEGNIEEALRSAHQLGQELDALARSLQSAEQQAQGSRFGPRERAMADAMEVLLALENEQRRLAGRTERVRREAATRALEAVGGAQTMDDGLRSALDAAESALESMDSRSLGPMDREALSSASQRLGDARAALEAGDLGEGRTMLETARGDVEQLARELELSAMMFGGRDGKVRESAEAARRGADQLRGASGRLDRMLPRLADHMQRDARQQLSEDHDRQGEVGDRADGLAEQFEASPDEAPLSPEAAQGVREALAEMRAAESALGEQRAIDAAEAQQRAAERLTELREDLEASQNDSQSGGEGGERGGESQEGDRVTIPANDARDDELRMRLLESMGGRAPAGYEDATRRYFEELLR